MRRLALLIALLLTAPALADIKLPKTFADHAVLQREAKVPVWGYAEPNEKVTVTFNGQTLQTQADAEGKFRVELAPMEPGGPFEMTVAAPSKTIKLRDLLVGDVWVCSGQSNMAYQLSGVVNGAEVAKAANHPKLRAMLFANSTAARSAMDLPAEWRPCEPPFAARFSGVGYYFARTIQAEVDLPIGLITNAWGGTRIESWMPRRTIESDSTYQWSLDYEKKLFDDYEAWKKQAEKLKAEGKPIPTQPAPPGDPAGSAHRPGVLYASLVEPLTDFPIKGVIWYQGESNVGTPPMYAKAMPRMIRDWRAAWNQGGFPFLYVQLPNMRAAHPEPGPSRYAEFREAQEAGLGEPNTAMAVTIDVGSATDIHPADKAPVGQRLGKAALSLAYGKGNSASSPAFDSMRIEGDTVRVKFKHAESGLTVKNGDTLRGFAVAGVDGKFYWADAKIDPTAGDTVVVRSEKVPQAAAVRYNWADNPDGNLYSKVADLPAVPFRTNKDKR